MSAGVFSMSLCTALGIVGYVCMNTITIIVGAMTSGCFFTSSSDRQVLHTAGDGCMSLSCHAMTML
jgi:hypothetical protein